MKKRILCTGHLGFVGSYLVPLLKKKYRVQGWDLASGLDIFDKDFEVAVRQNDVVIHLAALTNVNWSFENADEVMRVNVLGTARVVELCVKYNKKLIYPSSAAVYHRELSPYAQSKALAEDICSQFKKNITILRFFNIYGEGMNEDTGSLMYEFVKGLKTGKLIVFGDGEQTRDFINIRDIVQIVETAVRKDWNGLTIDCGTGQAYSVNYIAELFGHYGKVKLKYQPPRREIKWSIADTQLLSRLYKRKLVTNLKKDIKELVDYYANS